MKVKLMVLAIITVIAMGCNSNKKKNSDSFDTAITGKYWKLKTIGGKEVKMNENQEREIFITLKTQDNRLTGFAGCNSVSGEFTLEEGNRVKFSKMVTTRMFCPDTDEPAFLKVLEMADNFTVKDDVLSLNVGRRAPLAVFEAVYIN